MSGLKIEGYSTMDAASCLSLLEAPPAVGGSGDAPVRGTQPEKKASDYVRRCVGEYLQSPVRHLFYSGGWYGWDVESGWLSCTGSDVEADAVRFLHSRGARVTRALVTDFLTVVRAGLSLPGDGIPALFFRLEDGLQVRTREAKHWIPTRSHYVNILTGQAVEVDGSLFTLGCVSCDYDPLATCPQWERFVLQSCPDDGEMLRAMFGLSLTFDRRFNVFFVVHGAAGTGKSTALALLAALNRGTACGVSLGAFGERFQTYPLTTNRLNLVQDMDSVFEGAGSVSQREAVLKSLTCGERIQVEQKHVAPEYRRLTALSVFGCNTLPRFADRSRAIADRLRIIRFPNVFRGTGGEVLNLAERLIQEELPGILNWSLAGYRSLVANGNRRFPETEASALLKGDLIKSSRPEELFFEECLTVGTPAEREPTRNVYTRYGNWCRFRGYRALAENAFSSRLRECFPSVQTTRIRCNGSRLTVYVGLRLLPCSDSLVQL
ncbi:MAG: DUF5906 domain-containing protein [Planctomycetia bacterium]|nr:DUF5906 domain-containing protein [Planctomycetia bacterium]